MGTQTDYFDKIGYKPKWHLGDRVSGTWNKIPFIGCVGNDREKDVITIHPDLPIMFDKKIHNVIIVKHKDIKKLPVWD